MLHKMIECKMLAIYLVCSFLCSIATMAGSVAQSTAPVSVLLLGGRSDCYFPLFAEDISSSSSSFSWNYSVNGGQPLSFDGSSISAQPFTVTSSPMSFLCTRSGTITGTSSGEDSGTVSSSLAESYAKVNGKTVLNTSTTMVQSDTTARDGTRTIGILTMTRTPSSGAAELLILKKTLADYSVGYTETVPFSMDVAVQITTQRGSDTESWGGESVTSLTETWTVKAKPAIRTVSGTTYRDVICVERLTKTLNENAELVSVTITYWLAKGVGVIESSGEYPCYGTLVPIALTSSQL
ncbi:MAG: hypothetical protein EOL87_12340 [Spartobacteria bacterium]|nr:hypothetical protein [Spartobacteria bacterium]